MKIFTAEELELVTKNYGEKKILETGEYGTVYKGTLRDKRVLVAIKKLKKVDESQTKQFINELIILTQIKHQNMVKFLGCCLEIEVPLLVYERVSDIGTLFLYMHKRGCEKLLRLWESRLRIAAEISRALAYLHSGASIPIIHGDIKSANILLDRMYTPIISDFGVLRLNPLDQTQIDTLGYLDPEFFLSGQLTDKSDVYSFGVVLAELLTGEKPVSYERPREQQKLASYFVCMLEKHSIFKIIQPSSYDGGELWQVVKVAEIARNCLCMKGEERPTMKQVAMDLESTSKPKRRDKKFIVLRNRDLMKSSNT
ncbi:wall-associated receptor kinase-like 9 [Papaver somniferum]|nr:wall-associated receptor kinase-like 9 [Papaver somniferum]